MQFPIVYGISDGPPWTIPPSTSLVVAEAEACA